MRTHLVDDLGADSLALVELTLVVDESHATSTALTGGEIERLEPNAASV